ncbi:transglycosylase SLT domain-containing protein [Ancylobacter terrae]|uniref:transglycosylase SLT domain-containing protein n=1 Tax=Ancylobacter sp. sgz301288 TaxID=3342077 RepID=UPI00385B3FFC
MRRSSVAVLALLSVAPCGVALTGVAGATEPKASAPAVRPAEAVVPSNPRVASVSTRKAAPVAGVISNADFPAEMAAPFAADWVTSPGPMGPAAAAGFALRGALSDNAAAAPPAAEPAPAPAVAVIAVPASPRLALASIPLPLKRSDAPPPRPSPALAMAPEAAVPAAFAGVADPATAGPAIPAAKEKPRLVAAPVPLPPKRPTRIAALAPVAVDTAAIASDAADAASDEAEATAPVVEAEPAARPVVLGKKRLTAAQAPPEIEALIERHSRRYDVPASLVRRVLWRESKYNPRARNGPYWGLMQIRVDTARGMGFRGDPADLLDGNTNMTYAVAYLANAWRVSGRNETRAVQLYAGGYYFEAKRKGLLSGLIKTALVD